MLSPRRARWRAALLTGLLSGTFSTIVITLGAARIGRSRALDWMEIGTVLLGADSVVVEPGWQQLAAGVLVHQSADLFWALVFFGAAGRWTAGLALVILLVVAEVTNVLQKYEDAHRHPVNRRLHTIGIPLIAISALGAVSPWRPFGWGRSTFVAGMAAGWGLLFAGHYIEGNRPVVFSNPTVLVTAPGWWVRRTIRVCLRKDE